MSGGPPVALTVAGTDSGGAAGVPADLATFAALGVHGACAVTAVTAQDTTGVHAVQRIDTAIVAAQIDAVLDDLPVGAVKTGMLGTPEVVALVAERLAGRPGRPLVVDPVLVATSGAVLGDRGVVRAYAALLPHVSVLTPNLDEARALLGAEHDADAAGPRELAGALAALGCGVVLTGGPPPDAVPDAVPDREAECVDWWCAPGGLPEAIAHPLVATRNDHGTGCTYSAAVAALLAAGCPVPDALRRAAAFTAARLRCSQGWRLGRGRGPVAHLLTDPLDPLDRTHDTAPTSRRTP